MERTCQKSVLAVQLQASVSSEDRMAAAKGIPLAYLGDFKQHGAVVHIHGLPLLLIHPKVPGATQAMSAAWH